MRICSFRLLFLLICSGICSRCFGEGDLDVWTYGSNCEVYSSADYCQAKAYAWIGNPRRVDKEAEIETESMPTLAQNSYDSTVASVYFGRVESQAECDATARNSYVSDRVYKINAHTGLEGFASISFTLPWQYETPNWAEAKATASAKSQVVLHGMGGQGAFDRLEGQLEFYGGYDYGRQPPDDAELTVNVHPSFAAPWEVKAVYYPTLDEWVKKTFQNFVLVETVYEDGYSLSFSKPYSLLVPTSNPLVPMFVTSDSTEFLRASTVQTSPVQMQSIDADFGVNFYTTFFDN
ncbi:MAG: hypothetical protein R3C28_02095 [Pirellulaceae bacterium]